VRSGWEPSIRSGNSQVTWRSICRLWNDRKIKRLGMSWQIASRRIHVRIVVRFGRLGTVVFDSCPRVDISAISRRPITLRQCLLPRIIEFRTGDPHSWQFLLGRRTPWKWQYIPQVDMRNIASRGYRGGLGPRCANPRVRFSVPSLQDCRRGNGFPGWCQGICRRIFSTSTWVRKVVAVSGGVRSILDVTQVV
jgi:hypothetical protein